MNIVEIRLKSGKEFPYDAPDEWWQTAGDPPPPPPKDWAVAAARGVIADLQDRRGIKWGFDNIDQETRAEIVNSLADIIRTAHVNAVQVRT